MPSARVRSPRDSKDRFVNWAKTVVTTPARWATPATVAALQELISAATKEGRRVRTVGAGHAWSSIAAPASNDVAVSLDEIAGLVSLDKAKGQAVVRGGTRLVHLGDALEREGYALPIVGSIRQQSIAGATATGTHGSSLIHGNLSSLVEEIEIVTASGERVRLAKGDPRFEGTRVHLGALGVVVSLTLRVEPMFRLAETIEAIPVKNVIGQLREISKSSEYVKVWWMPHSPYAQVFRYERTTEPTSKWPSPATQRWVDEVIMQRSLFPALLFVERAWPACIPVLNRFVAGTFQHGRRVGPSYAMLTTPMPVLHRESEAALPMDRADEALDRIVSVVTRDKLRGNAPLELRFVRGDDAWMSPAQGADTCQIGAYIATVAGIEEYFAAFWREMRALGARPHWGKEMDHDAAELRMLYPLMPKFLELRDAFDPKRIFSSPFLDRALG